MDRHNPSLAKVDLTARPDDPVTIFYKKSNAKAGNPVVVTQGEVTYEGTGASGSVNFNMDFVSDKANQAVHCILECLSGSITVKNPTLRNYERKENTGKNTGKEETSTEADSEAGA